MLREKENQRRASDSGWTSPPRLWVAVLRGEMLLQASEMDTEAFELFIMLLLLGEKRGSEVIRNRRRAAVFSQS